MTLLDSQIAMQDQRIKLGQTLLKVATSLAAAPYSRKNVSFSGELDICWRSSHVSTSSLARADRGACILKGRTT